MPKLSSPIAPPTSRTDAAPAPLSPSDLLDRHLDNARRQLDDAREQLRQARRRVVQLEEAVGNWELLRRDALARERERTDAPTLG
jgi:hypothetical protein